MASCGRPSPAVDGMGWEDDALATTLLLFLQCVAGCVTLEGLCQVIRQGGQAIVQPDHSGIHPEMAAMV